MSKDDMLIEDNESVPSFEYDGMEIVNPYMDETGRFSVNPKEYYGIENFTLWQKRKLVIESKKII